MIGHHFFRYFLECQESQKVGLLLDVKYSFKFSIETCTAKLPEYLCWGSFCSLELALSTSFAKTFRNCFVHLSLPGTMSGERVAKHRAPPPPHLPPPPLNAQYPTHE